MLIKYHRKTFVPSYHLNTLSNINIVSLVIETPCLILFCMINRGSSETVLFLNRLYGRSFEPCLVFHPLTPSSLSIFFKFYVTMYNLHLFVPMICTCMFSFCDVVGTLGGFGLYLGVFLIYCAICTYGWDIHQLY